MKLLIGTLMAVMTLVNVGVSAAQPLPGGAGERRQTKADFRDVELLTNHIANSLNLDEQQYRAVYRLNVDWLERCDRVSPALSLKDGILRWGKAYNRKLNRILNRGQMRMWKAADLEWHLRVLGKAPVPGDPKGFGPQHQRRDPVGPRMDRGKGRRPEVDEARPGRPAAPGKVGRPGRRGGPRVDNCDICGRNVVGPRRDRSAARCRMAAPGVPEAPTAPEAPAAPAAPATPAAPQAPAAPATPQAPAAPGYPQASATPAAPGYLQAPAAPAAPGAPAEPLNL